MLWTIREDFAMLEELICPNNGIGILRPANAGVVKGDRLKLHWQV